MATGGQYRRLAEGSDYGACRQAIPGKKKRSCSPGGVQAGRARGVGHLRPMARLVEHDVRDQLAPAHRVGAARDRKRERLACVRLVEALDVLAKVGASPDSRTRRAPAQSPAATAVDSGGVDPSSRARWRRSTRNMCSTMLHSVGKRPPGWNARSSRVGSAATHAAPLAAFVVAVIEKLQQGQTDAHGTTSSTESTRIGPRFSARMPGSIFCRSPTTTTANLPA